MDKFIEKMQSVDESYKRRIKEEEEIWRGFKEEVQGLTDEVSRGFRTTLDTLSPTMKRWDDVIFPVSVNNFEVEYYPNQKDFGIKIIDWFADMNGVKISDKGRDRRCCAYEGLKMILSSGLGQDTLVSNFMENYFVRRISYDCQCGSDHK